MAPRAENERASRRQSAKVASEAPPNRRPAWVASLSKRSATRSGEGRGKGLSRRPSTTLKIAALAPIPRASERMAAAAKPGERRNERRPKRRSRTRVDIVENTSDRNVSIFIALNREQRPEGSRPALRQ